ncbi:consortin-like [Mizuhopecten yessoensis]|uniref:Consortin N-terminal domain-containing protein n=1 Tax=Mizuhopecten yessoensis TaxID=6573 RepID=A0A210QXC6_MIZYE|nr:consortin-like [Mizuhopecten yessoensis]XP_021347310.1 consortin-like [Mizuhopecten yessoensis]OWF53407.1 hypothetical protein KP79_PYT10505 [Mizuhopecten yessoensis]
MAEETITTTEMDLQSLSVDGNNSVEDIQDKDEHKTETTEDSTKCNPDKPEQTKAESSQDVQSSDSGVASSEESSTENGETTVPPDEEKNQETQDQEAIEDDDAEVDLGDLTQLDSNGRNALFEKGLTYDKNGKKNCALKCYLASVKSLQPDSHFPLLPQCLRNIADIFYRKDELNRAVHFIQAEKMYYETVLIDNTEIQARLDEAEKIKENGEKVDQNMDSVRAEEYEHLAKLCLDKNQPQLALEYAGKATKIRQQLLGDSHPVTVQSLDFFTSVYAKVGQEQYQESMKKLSSPEGDENSEQNNDPASPVSILRKRKTGEKEEKKVRFHESQVQNHEQDHASDEMLAKKVLWALLLICCVLMVVLASYLYCKLNPHSITCGSIRTNFYYTYMRIKYYYYHYSSNGEGAKYT